MSELFIFRTATTTYIDNKQKLSFHFWSTSISPLLTIYHLLIKSTRLATHKNTALLKSKNLIIMPLLSKIFFLFLKPSEWFVRNTCLIFIPNFSYRGSNWQYLDIINDYIYRISFSYLTTLTFNILIKNIKHNFLIDYQDYLSARLGCYWLLSFLIRSCEH